MTGTDRLAARLGRVLEFLWSGWAGLAALSLLAAIWQAGHEAYGPFILTSPLATLQAVGQILADPGAWQLAAVTLQRALTGFLLVAGTGTALGLIAGYSPACLRLAAPLITALLGVPLCWVILTMGMWTQSNVINGPLLSYEVTQAGFGMFVKWLLAGFLYVFAISMLVQFAGYFLANAAVLLRQPDAVPVSGDAHGSDD